MARQLGENVATDWFAMMLNPKNRGPNLTWEGLDQIVRSQAGTQVSMSVKCRPENEDGLKDLAAESASKQLRRLMEASGVENWLPLPEGPRLVSYICEDEVLVCAAQDESCMLSTYMGKANGRDPGKYSRVEHERFTEVELRSGDSAKPFLVVGL